MFASLGETISVSTTLWIVGHLFAIGIFLRRGRTLVLVVSLMMICGAYVTKPLTYDLKEYDIYFRTGYHTEATIEIQNNGDTIIFGNLQRTSPYRIILEFWRTGSEGFEPGFALFARTINMFVPKSARYNLDIMELEVGGGSYGEHRWLNEPALFLQVFRRTGKDQEIIWRLPIALIYVSFIGIMAAVLLNILSVENKSNRFSTDDCRWLTFLVIVVGSIFVLLGTQNVLRQYFGTLFILTGVSLFQKRHKKLGSVAFIIAPLFHYASVAVALIAFVLSVLNSRTGTAIQNGSRGFVWMNRLLVAFVGLVLFGLIRVILLENTIVQDIPGAQLARETMLAMGIGNDSEFYRIWFKGTALLIVFLSSEFLIHRSSYRSAPYIAEMRRLVLICILPFIMMPEIFSRLSLLYFGTEMILASNLAVSTEWRERAGAFLVFCSYGFAPSALKILSIT